MNLRFLVNKAITLLSFGQTQVVVSFRLMFRLSCLCFCGDSNLSSKCLYLFFSFKFNDENLCFNWNRVFLLCHDLKVLEVIHNLWSIIDGVIVKIFLECIFKSVLLREDGDDQPLILQTKLILKETLMIVHVQH